MEGIFNHAFVLFYREGSNEKRGGNNSTCDEEEREVTKSKKTKREISTVWWILLFWFRMHLLQEGCNTHLSLFLSLSFVFFILLLW